jgi:hypothetical protein
MKYADGRITEEGRALLARQAAECDEPAGQPVEVGQRRGSNGPERDVAFGRRAPKPGSRRAPGRDVQSGQHQDQAGCPE